MRRSLGFATALGFIVVAAATARAEVKTMDITFKSGDDEVKGFLAEPDGKGPFPAIVVIQEWWGLTDWIKENAKRLAEQGYVALAPDLYRGKVATDPTMARRLMGGLPADRAVRDLKGAVEALAARDNVDKSRLASIGWCMGGGYSLDAAIAEPTLAGTVIYYGHLMTDPKTIASLKVPLLGNFGGQDQGIPPADVKAFEEAVKKAGGRVDFKIYPDAGHAFASSKDPSVFRPADAKDADARTDAFLSKVLKGK